MGDNPTDKSRFFGALHNQRGIFHVVLVLILALIGGWYLYRSFNAGTLSSDLSSMLNDSQRAFNSANMSPSDQNSLAQAYTTISHLAAKYRLDNKLPTQPTVADGQ